MKLVYRIVFFCFILFFCFSAFYVYDVSHNKHLFDSDGSQSFFSSFIKSPNVKSSELTIVGDFLYEEPYYNAIRNGEDMNLYFSYPH